MSEKYATFHTHCLALTVEHTLFDITYFSWKLTLL